MPERESEFPSQQGHRFVGTVDRKVTCAQNVGRPPRTSRALEDAITQVQRETQRQHGPRSRLVGARRTCRSCGTTTAACSYDLPGTGSVGKTWLIIALLLRWPPCAAILALPPDMQMGGSEWVWRQDCIRRTRERGKTVHGHGNDLPGPDEMRNPSDFAQTGTVCTLEFVLRHLTQGGIFARSVVKPKRHGSCSFFEHIARADRVATSRFDTRAVELQTQR